MKTRRLGRTGIQVSELIFGCGNVGGLMIRGAHDDQRAAVQTALEAGINWFDTAAAYGDGKSETALGRVLSELGAAPHVSTKVRIDTDRMDDLAGRIERNVTDSLHRLGLGRVDLLQFHNPIAAEPGRRAVAEADVLRAGGIADGLERLREQGLTEHIGLTALGEADCCRRVIESGRFDSAQVYYNMLNPSAARLMPGAWTGQNFGGLMAACRSQDMGIIAIRVFAAGYLASAERHGRESILTSDTIGDEEARKAEACAAALGTGHGTRAEAAVRFVLANDDVSAVNVGLASHDQLKAALQAQARGPLPEAALSRIDRLYETDFREDG